MPSRHPFPQALAAFLAAVVAAALLVAAPPPAFAAGCNATQDTEFSNQAELQAILSDPAGAGCAAPATLTVDFSAGSFALTEPLVWSQANQQVDFVGPAPGNRTSFSGNDTFHPIQGDDGTVGLRNIDVSDGLNDFTGPGATGNGGAISVKNLILNDVSVTDSRVAESSTSGGCIFATGTVSLTDAEIDGCQADADGGSAGGCIYTDASVDAVDTRIESCSASGNGSFGAGIYAVGPVTISSTDPQTFTSTIDTATARVDGGCILANGAISLTDVNLLHCTAQEGSGGAILANDSTTATVSLTRVSIDTCSAELNGGGVAVATTTGNTLTDTAVDNCTANGFGGAVHAQGSLSVTGDSSFTGNSAAIGGAIYSNYVPADPTAVAVDISDSSFDANSSTEGPGGAVRSIDDVVVSGSTFTSGSASDIVFDGMAGGGAVSAGQPSNSAKVTIASSTFDGNGSDRGGAVSVSGELNASDSVFIQNASTAGAPGGIGGALDATTVNVEGSTFHENVTTNDGGAIAGATVEVITSSFEQNRSMDADGGAISATTASVADSTFNANSAGADGGAIRIAGGNLSLTFSTLTENTAAGHGNAIHRSIDTGDFTSIGSVYGSPTDETQCSNLSGSSASTYNATEPGDDSCGFTSGTNLTPTWAEMALGPPQLNGGTTTNRMPGSSSWLKAAVPNALGATALPSGVDQRGVARQNSYWIGAAQDTTPATPGAPLIDTISGATSSLSVAFTAPTVDVLPNVTTYEYSTDNGSTWRTRSAGTTESPLRILTTSAADVPLVDGTAYPVRIRAVNASGSGSRSNRVTGTPVFVPDQQPGSVSVTGLRIDSASRVTATVAFGTDTTGLEFRTRTSSDPDWSDWHATAPSSTVEIPVRVRKGTWIEVRATGPGGYSPTTQAFVRAQLPRLGEPRGDAAACRLPRLASIEYHDGRGRLRI